MTKSIQTIVDFGSNEVRGLDEGQQLILMNYFSNVIASSGALGSTKMVFKTCDIPGLAEQGLGHFEVAINPCDNDDNTYFDLDHYEEFTGKKTAWEMRFKRVSEMEALVLIDTIIDEG